MDMFELLSPSDKSLNDFFTPPSISKSLSEILIRNIDTTKESISLYDPTCGIGRLLYYSLMDIKTRFPEKKVYCCGCDIFPKYSVFTQSILDLVNYNSNEIFIGNSLYVKFKNKFDCILGNPPFGDMKEEDYKKYIQFHMYFDDTLRDKVDKKYRNLPKLTEEEVKQLSHLQSVLH